MSEYDTVPTEAVTPVSFRAEMQRLRALRDNPEPVRADALFLADDWILDWKGVREDDPHLFAAMMQSTSDNNGQCVMPPDVWQSLVDRGYLVRRTMVEE